MLIDGNSLAYRAFFALPTDLATASGQVTNAVFGFTSMLVNLVRDHEPDHLAVAFDRPEPTFRHEAVADYKANRTEAPDILRQQLGLVRQVVEVLHIPMLEVPGFEADDIIATLATQARDRGDDVLVVTGDRDSYQLVEDPHIRVLYNRRGVSDYALYDEAGIAERTGVTPAQYLEYASMRGDPSDNLPGVPGVGEKTAAKLINTYGDLDGIFAHLDELTPKLRQNLGEAEGQVRSNAVVMKLVRDVPLDVDLDALVFGDYDLEEVRQLFDFLEFRTLYDRLLEALAAAGVADLPDASGSGLDVVEPERTDLTTVVDAVGLLAALLDGEGPLAVAATWAGTEGRSDLEGLALVTDAASGDVAWLPVSLLAQDEVSSALRRLFADGARQIVAHHAKALMRSLAAFDVEVCTLELDTMIAAYLLDPAEAR